MGVGKHSSYYGSHRLVYGPTAGSDDTIYRCHCGLGFAREDFLNIHKQQQHREKQNGSNYQ